MPTIADRPSLRETQAIGVTLLHQFARERFRHAGIGDDELLREAEVRENLDSLASVLLDEESNENSNMPNCESVLNETHNTSLHSNGSNTTNNTTIRCAGGDDGLANGTLDTERFHSMAESSSSLTANETRQEDRTMYHSINGGNHSETMTSELLQKSALDRLETSPRLAAYGRELRRMADEFERSRLRRTVKEQAESMDFSDITREGFINLVEVLFEGKITREKVVILFFFCTDVALCAFQKFAGSATDIVVKLLGWSFSYIINTFSSFIYQLGGWDKVLFYQFPSMLVSCCAALAMFSLVVYLRKSFSRVVL